MSRQKMGLFGTLATVGAVSAVAGFAWRWAQRHRGASPAAHRDLSRWEGEGGSLVGAADTSAPQNGVSVSGVAGAAQAANGEDAWPFPHSTRH